MFAVVQLDGEKWGLSWDGEVFLQVGLNTRLLAELKLVRYQQRYPNRTWDHMTLPGGKRGGPYRYSWEEQWHDYLPDGVKPSGLLVHSSRTAAKDYMRYRLEKRSVSQERIRTLLTQIRLEAV